MPDPELEVNMMFTKAYYIYSWSFTEKTMQRIKILGEVVQVAEGQDHLGN